MRSFLFENREYHLLRDIYKLIPSNLVDAAKKVIDEEQYKLQFLDRMVEKRPDDCSQWDSCMAKTDYEIFSERHPEFFVVDFASPPKKRKVADLSKFRLMEVDMNYIDPNKYATMMCIALVCENPDWKNTFSVFYAEKIHTVPSRAIFPMRPLEKLDEKGHDRMTMIEVAVKSEKDLFPIWVPAIVLAFDKKELHFQVATFRTENGYPTRLLATQGHFRSLTDEREIFFTQE